MLPTYTSVGSYPLFYQLNGDVLCASCASEKDLQESDGNVHWEGEPLDCDECSTQIESAYGVPEEKEDSMLISELPTYWVLCLNDMRSAHYERLQPVAKAKSVRALKDFLERERVPVYKEPKGTGNDLEFWGKVFRKGGPLEWFNDFYKSDEPCHFVEINLAEDLRQMIINMNSILTAPGNQEMVQEMENLLREMG